MIIQLNPPLPLITPRGKVLAHFLIDNGPEFDLQWVCFLDDSGECWTYPNPMIRAQKNITQGREYISPFYDTQDVAFPKGWVHESAMQPYETALQKQVREAKRMSETMPNFEHLVKGTSSILDDRISKISSELRGKELQILDDFCKAYYAAETHMTGRDFMQIVDEVSLNIQQFFKDGQVGTRYWFDRKEKNE